MNFTQTQKVMPNSGDTELEESTFRSQTGPPVKGLGHNSPTKLLTEIWFCLKEMNEKKKSKECQNSWPVTGQF